MFRNAFLLAMSVVVAFSPAVLLAKPVVDDTAPKQVYLRPQSYDFAFDASAPELLSGEFWFLIWILQGPRRLSLVPGTEGYDHYEVIRKAMICPLASSEDTEGAASAACQTSTFGSCLKVTYDPVADVVLDVSKAVERKCYLADPV